MKLYEDIPINSTKWIHRFFLTLNYSEKYQKKFSAKLKFLVILVITDFILHRALMCFYKQKNSTDLFQLPT